MKRLTSQGWETLRTLTAITAAIGTMICLLILAGCTNELTGQDENRGNGQALTLGTVSIEGGNTRAAVWEYKGEDAAPELTKEPLNFEFVHPAQRNYKD